MCISDVYERRRHGVDGRAARLDKGVPDGWILDLSTYDDDRQFFALPLAPRLARTALGQPDLWLEYIVPGGGSAHDSLYAVIEMGLEYTHNHDEPWLS